MAMYSLRGVAPELPADATAWVAPCATVIGRVSLGSHASVWFGARIRADHEAVQIGERSNIQENAVVHVDPTFPVSIGADTTIGHQAIVHGCTIGDGVTVGMGAIIMNGAVIGHGSIVAAGAVVTEGKVFPEHALIVGAPAKVVRTLDEAVVERLRRTAANYVDNAESMATQLVQVA